MCTRADVLNKDVICDPKIGDAEYLNLLSRGQTVFGWVHATQNKNITDIILKRGLRAVAWEKCSLMADMFSAKAMNWPGRAPSSMPCFLMEATNQQKCAVIGNGNTARGVTEALSMLVAEITQYPRNLEALFWKRTLQF